MSLLNGYLAPMEYTEDDLAPAEVPVKYGKKELVLREATAEAARLFRNSATRGARLMDDKSVILSEVGEAEITLLANCLFEKFKGGDRPVGASFVRGMLSHIARELFDRAKKISRLDEEPSEAELDKQITELTALRDKKQKAVKGKDGEESGSSPQDGPGDEAKNSPSATTVTSV